MYSKFYVFMFVTYTRMTAVNRIFFIVSVTIYMSNGAVAGVSVVTLGTATPSTPTSSIIQPRVTWVTSAQTMLRTIWAQYLSVNNCDHLHFFQ